MRRELTGICLLFFVLLTLLSFISYCPDDFSFDSANNIEHVDNFFGLAGAYIADFFIEILFGLGAFWIPVLLAFFSLRYFRGHIPDNKGFICLGSFFLIFSTGSMFSFSQYNVVIFDREFSSGGAVGIFFFDLIVRYTNTCGAVVIFILLFLIGIILVINFSLIDFFIKTYKKIISLIKLIYKQVVKRKKGVFSVEKSGTEKKLIIKKNKNLKNINKSVKVSKKKRIKIDENIEILQSASASKLPPISFLNDSEKIIDVIDENKLKEISLLLENKLKDFGVKGVVSEVLPGPVITTFEYKPAPGVKISKILNLTDDLALALRALSIRVVAPIPGKAAVGIEIPNAIREDVCFKDIVTSDNFVKSRSKLTVCLGKDISGEPVVAQLDKMPHLLIAGATGTGKSVGLNTMITSLLYKSSPEDVKMIMIDPKRIELSLYEGIPHLITPVVVDMKKATNALFWAVREMEKRYELLSENKARNIIQYNKKLAKEKTEKDNELKQHLPYIVIIIDELSDLMTVASKEVEVALTRLAQMARAAGIHIVLATQRPSVDVLTGVIKANFPTRISFQVSSKIDSRTIIDSNGAESLLGNGDMLFLPPGTGKLKRIQGAYISEEEVGRIVDFLKEQSAPEYDETVVESNETDEDNNKGEGSKEYDEKYDEAVALVTNTGHASISMVQRHLRIGYNRAARIIEIMEKEGVIGPADGAKKREILVKSYE